MSYKQRENIFLQKQARESHKKNQYRLKLSQIDQEQYKLKKQLNSKNEILKIISSDQWLTNIQQIAQLNEERQQIFAYSKSMAQRAIDLNQNVIKQQKIQNEGKSIKIEQLKSEIEMEKIKHHSLLRQTQIITKYINQKILKYQKLKQDLSREANKANDFNNQIQSNSQIEDYLKIYSSEYFKVTDYEFDLIKNNQIETFINLEVIKLQRQLSELHSLQNEAQSLYLQYKMSLHQKEKSNIKYCKIFNLQSCPQLNELNKTFEKLINRQNFLQTQIKKQIEKETFYNKNLEQIVRSGAIRNAQQIQFERKKQFTNQKNIIRQLLSFELNNSPQIQERMNELLQKMNQTERLELQQKTKILSD